MVRPEEISSGSLSADAANRRYFRQAYRTGRHGWTVEDPSPYAVHFLSRLNRLVPEGELLDNGAGHGTSATGESGEATGC